MIEKVDIRDVVTTDEVVTGIKNNIGLASPINIGLLSSDTFSKSLLYKGAIWDAGINSTKVNGIYYKNSGTAGLPQSRKGYITVISDELNIKQLYEDIVSDLRAFRLSTDGGNTWGSWIIR